MNPQANVERVAEIRALAGLPPKVTCIGEIVHYWDSWRSNLTPYAAMVIYVNDDGDATLLVTNPNGMQFVASAEWSATPKAKHWSYRP